MRVETVTVTLRVHLCCLHCCVIGQSEPMTLAYSRTLYTTLSVGHGWWGLGRPRSSDWIGCLVLYELWSSIVLKIAWGVLYWEKSELLLINIIFQDYLLWNRLGSSLSNLKKLWGLIERLSTSDINMTTCYSLNIDAEYFSNALNIQRSNNG